MLAACGGDGSVGSTETPEASETPAGDSGVTGLCSNLYFPAVEGATWTYTSVDASGPHTYTSFVSNVRADGFTLTHDFGELTATQEWTCTSEGLSALEYSGGPEATVTTSGLAGTFETRSSSGVSAPYDLVIGETWTQTYEIHGDLEFNGQVATADGIVSQTYTGLREESVSVPAGTFNAIVVEGNTQFELQMSLGEGISVPFSFESITTNWWVRNLGWVKSTSTVSADGTGEPFEATTELTSYSIP